MASLAEYKEKQRAQRNAANDDLSKAMAADQAKPLFGGGILNSDNRTGAATGKGTQRSSVGRQNYKPAKTTGASATGGGAPKGAANAPAPTPKVTAKPAAKKSAPAKAKAKPREDTWKNMTRTGMKDSDGPKKLTGGNNRPKRVSPGADAIKAAQPNRKDYKGGMVLRGPEKSKSGLRRDK